MIDGLLTFAASPSCRSRRRPHKLPRLLEFDGEHLDAAQLIDILWNLIGGGVDTTTSLTSLT